MIENNDIILCVLVFVISIFSTLAGVGGGGIYTSLLLITYRFDITKVIPISVSLIFSTSFVNVIYFVINKGHKSLTKYNVLISIVPFLSCCSFVGAIMLKVMPKLITMLTIIIVTLFSLHKSINRYMKLCEKELAESIELNENEYTNIAPTNITPASVVPVDDNDEDIEMVTSYNFNEPDTTSSTKIGDTYCQIFGNLAILLTIVITEGAFSFGRKYVGSCSNNYVYISVSQVIFTGFVSLFCYWFVKKDRQSKITNNYDFDESDTEINKVTFSKLGVLGTIVSVLSTYTGLGGGVILNPILLSLKLAPKYVVATSCVFIWLGSMSSLINFAIDGVIDWYYAIMFSVCAMLGTICGLVMYNFITNKLKKQSILVLCLIVIAMLTICLLIINMLLYGKVSDMKFSSNCEAK